MHKYRPFLHMLLILMFLLQVVSATLQSHGTQGEDGSAAGVAPAPTAIATPGTGQIPLGGQPRPIPGVVEAEFYDIGGEGVAYHDTTPGNTGGEYRSDDVDLEYKDGANLNVGWGADGEWIEYTMDVAKGEYVIDARLACADSGRSPAVSMGGSVLATIDVPNTGAWSAFEVVTKPDVYVDKGGVIVLRVTMNGGGSNFDYLRFRRPTAPTPTATAISAPSPTGGDWNFYDDVDHSVTFLNTWQSSSHGGSYFNTRKSASRDAASALFHFKGRRARFYGARGPDLGIAEIYLEGQRIDTVDCYAETQENQVLLSEGVASWDGFHTMQVMVTGKKNGKSSSTRLIVDAFSTDGVSANTVYPGTWPAPGNLSDMHVKMKRKHDDDRTTHPDAQWFYQAPMLGLFMHWGIVSAHPDTGAAWKFCPWPRMKGDLDINDLWAQVSTWNAADYDPYKWMSAAKDAGFKYAVLTVKHHDGYCLWPTKYGDMNTKVGPMKGRDLLAEYIDACKAHGIKAGIFFSGFDWYYEEIWSKSHNISYYDYSKGQVDELINGYDIDIWWWDGGSRGVPNSYVKERLRNKGVVFNNRGDPTGGHGNFVTPEYMEVEEYIVRVLREGWFWESNTIWNNSGWHWGPGGDTLRDGLNYATSRLTKLAVPYHGHLLLNVAPKPDGTFASEVYNIWDQLGDWMRTQGFLQ